MRHHSCVALRACVGTLAALLLHVSAHVADAQFKSPIYTLTETEQRELSAGRDELGKAIKALRQKLGGAGHVAARIPDAAIYFEPTSVDEITEAMFAVLDRPEHLVERGLERASRFTWEATARRHDGVYRALAAV